MATPIRVPVVPQPPTGPSLSLLDMALDPPPVNLDEKTIGDRWEQGFAWTTRQGSTITGRNDCGPLTVATYRTATAVKRTHQPVIIAAVNDATTTIGTPFEYQRATAEAALVAGEPMAAELELWEGTLARAAFAAGDDAFSGNLWLTKFGVSTDQTPTPGTGVTPARGVGVLEGFLAGIGYGSAGMIHLPAALITHLEPGLTRVGAKLYSARGTLIVPGVGYTGTGPASGAGGAATAPATGNVYAYATGLVTYRHGDIQVTTDSDGQAVMPAVNQRVISAQRSTAGTWDTSVGHVLIAFPS